MDNGTVAVDEGTTATNTGTFADPGADTVSFSASIGTVTGNGNGTWSWSFDTADGPDESQTVVVTATDSDGAATSVAFDLTVNNVAPSIVADNSTVTVDAGSTTTNTGTFADPGVDIVSLAASVGAITQNGGGTWSWSFDTQDQDSQTVTVTATDSDGESTTTTFELVVNDANVPPVIVKLISSATLKHKSVAGKVKIKGAFTDENTGDTHTVSVDWGDGSEVEEIRVDLAGRTFFGKHAYASGGIFAITVSVDDGQGGVATDTTTAVVQGIGLVNGVLYVIGTDHNDNVQIHRQRGDRVKVDVKLGRDRTPHAVFDLDDVDSYTVFACGGHDHVHIDERLEQPAKILGGRGHDHLRSGGGDDVIKGGAGNDRISSGGGNDRITDLVGNNEVWSGPGNDRIVTGHGNDWIVADQGHDAIAAGNGSNQVWAGSGNDSIVSGSGNDRLDGGSGNDVILAGAGNDEVRAGSGNDIVSGHTGNDWIDGGGGHDLLIGGSGSDRIHGKSGKDLMIAGSAANENNIVALQAALAHWTTGDLTAALVNLGSITDDDERDYMKGGHGDDELIGGSGDKLLP